MNRVVSYGSEEKREERGLYSNRHDEHLVKHKLGIDSGTSDDGDNEATIHSFE